VDVSRPNWFVSCHEQKHHEQISWSYDILVIKRELYMQQAMIGRTGGRGVRLLGSPSDIGKIAAELPGRELKVMLHESSFCLEPLNSMGSPAATEWRTYEFARLTAAAARLRFGILSPIQLTPVEDYEGKALPTLALSTDRPTLSQILNVAIKRDQIRKALLSYAAGGAVGLFDAYEAVCHEIMNRSFPSYAAGCGTKEWMVQQGWIEEEEDDRFLKTVLQFRQNGGGNTFPFQPFSPYEAEVFVRRVLLQLIAHCDRTIGSPTSCQLMTNADD
jgi:hypothetical protein